MTGRSRLAMLVVTLALAAGAAGAEPPLWVARGARATVILFGSVHLLPPGLAWRTDALAGAMARADELWFELPIDEATSLEAGRLSRARGMLRARDRLSAHLTADQNLRLARVARILDIPLASLERMRPWLAEVTISLAIDTRDGAVASQGVEQQVQLSAPAETPRRAFESAAQQIGFLAGASLRDQLASLAETLTEFETAQQTYSRLVEEWRAGDVSGLATDALTPAQRAAPGSYRRLITDRNRRWTRIIARRLSRPGTVLVVVGVAHLIGPGGVPALLRAQGFQVDGP